MTEFLQGCGHGNPTISFDGTDALSATDPMPQPCDRQGPAQCAPPTGTTTSLTGPDRVPAGTVVTLNATVAPATAAGTVQFLDGDGQRLLDAVRVLNGAAQLTTILASGNHSIIARFGPHLRVVRRARRGDDQ